MDKNTIFYYRFQENGETVIGQAKFKTLRMKLRNITFRNVDEKFTGGVVDYGVVILAPTMKEVEVRKGKIFQLYPTFDDAVNDKHPVFDTFFKQEPHFNCSFAETLGDTLQDVWDTLPECLDLKRMNNACVPTAYYIPCGYKWEGTKAVQTSCSDVIFYDLLEHQCVVSDWNALDGVYYSEDDCKANNAVRCYTF